MSAVPSNDAAYVKDIVIRSAYTSLTLIRLRMLRASLQSAHSHLAYLKRLTRPPQLWILCSQREIISLVTLRLYSRPLTSTSCLPKGSASPRELCSIKDRKSHSSVKHSCKFSIFLANMRLFRLSGSNRVLPDQFVALSLFIFARVSTPPTK